MLITVKLSECSIGKEQVGQARAVRAPTEQVVDASRAYLGSERADVSEAVCLSWQPPVTVHCRWTRVLQQITFLD